MRLELIAFTRQGNALAAHLSQLLQEQGHDAQCTRENLRVEDWAKRAFQRAEGLIFVGAAGIAVRSIAPCVQHKSKDPAVLVLDEKGQFVIPILSGHLGGANDLSRQVATLIHAIPVITTATDVNHIFSVDQWARRQRLKVVNPEKIVIISSKLLAGQPVTWWSRWEIEGTCPTNLVWAQREQAEIVIDWYHPTQLALWLSPQKIQAGMGCRKGTKKDVLKKVLQQVITDHGLVLDCVERICSIDLKAEEQGLLELCQEMEVPFETYSSQTLSKVEGKFTASPFVQTVTGIDNVCERAAMMNGDNLLVHKYAENGVTVALAAKAPVLSWRDWQ